MIKTIIEIIVLMVCVAALGAMVYCLIGSVKFYKEEKRKRIESERVLRSWGHEPSYVVKKREAGKNKKIFFAGFLYEEKTFRLRGSFFML